MSGRRDGEGPISAKPVDRQQERNRLRAVGMALQLGSTVVGSLLVFLGGGIWLDRHFHTSPLFLLLGMILAFVVIGYNLYELATVSTSPRRVPGATTTATAKAASETRPRRDDDAAGDD